MSAPTLYDEAKAAGIALGSHESDLYLIDGPPTRALLFRHGARMARTFRNQIDGQTWWDVPFGYAPFWRSRGSA